MTQRLASKARWQAEVPEGYQFGNGNPCGRDGHTWPVTAFGVDAFCVKCGHKAEYGGSDWKGCEQFRPADESLQFKPWRAPHLNAAEQIEQAHNRNIAERLTRKFDRDDKAYRGQLRRDWNVIEGDPD